MNRCQSCFDAVGDAQREADHKDRGDGARDRGALHVAAHRRAGCEAPQRGIQADGEDRPQAGGRDGADAGRKRDAMTL